MTRKITQGMSRSGHCAWPTLNSDGVSSHCRCNLDTCTCACHEPCVCETPFTCLAVHA